MLFLTGVKKECNVSHQRGREGQQFGNYRLLQLLGRGGYGEVYLGEHLYLQTQVAVKVLAASPEQWVRDLIRTEARTHARLDHPNIVRILDFGFEQDVPYLVMAYAPGGTLRTLHPRGTPLPLRRITFYVYEIAKALQYAHDQKVIHRDVKPENLLLGPGNTIQLSDFGLAVVAHQTHSLSEQDALGTTMYMAPEQARGHARPASDQYALGVLVYEWLTGYPPFTVISKQAHSTKGWSKRYTCSCELLNTQGKGSARHPARPIEKARASPAMFLRQTDHEKAVLRAPQ